MAFRGAPQERLFRKALSRVGLAVAFTTRGDEAWAWLQANPEPKAVVTAVVLEGMDGFALSTAIRRDPRLESVPILFLGANGNTVPVQEFEAEWRARLEPTRAPCDVLVYPFHPDELGRRVEALVTPRTPGGTEREG